MKYIFFARGNTAYSQRRRQKNCVKQIPGTREILRGNELVWKIPASHYDLKKQFWR